MPGQFVDPSQALDEAAAASRHARREKLLRALRSQETRTRVALGLCGCIAIGALAAFCLAGDRQAAALIAVIAASSAGVAIAGGQAGRKKLLKSLRESDQLA